MAPRRLLVPIFAAVFAVVVTVWVCQWSRIADTPHPRIAQLQSELAVERRLNQQLHAELTLGKQQQQQRNEGPAASPSALPAGSGALPAASKQFTAVLMSYPKSDRFHRLESIIKEIKGWQAAREVLLVWNGDASLVPERIRALEGTGMRILPQAANKLDNRWRVWREVSTEAILNLDDDVDIKEKGVRCMFDVWRSAPHRIVAVDVRSHSDDPHALARAGQRAGMKVDTWAYRPRHTDESGRKVYSIALPRALMGHRDFWRAYDAIAPQMRSLVDDLLCDDIAFNFVAANVSQSGPIYARAPFAPFAESNSKNSLQKLKNMKQRRQKCLPALSALFENKMVLRYTSWFASCAWDGESGNHS